MNLKSVLLAMSVFTLGLISTAAAGPSYVVTAQGNVIAGQANGTLSGLDGKSFVYNAIFDLNLGGVPTLTNSDGTTMYVLDNGGAYPVSAAVTGGPTYASNRVVVGFDNDITENWVSNPDLSFLNLGILGIADGDPQDIVELLHNDTATGIEVSMNFLFDQSYFSSENLADLPTTIDQADVIVAAGSFIDWDVATGFQEIGKAEFLVTGFSITERILPSDGQPGTSTVPAPGAFLLAGLGTGLVGYMRRRRTL